MIGSRIKDLRKSKKMSQSDLGKMIGVSQTTVTAWETGRAEPASAYISKLADFFNVSADYLLGRPEKKTDTTKSDKIEDMLDSAMTFDGKPLSNNDRNVIRGMIEAYLKNKE
ncbi:MAG: helix-turn-helix domain-containing protein [Ligilactobacillus animalis]|uniref:helix-turn-helix domain-containing protein n=1 Tax=Ligilactobacillus animalis TaxID=1605 RepID=UPI00242BC69F|nr:helix-turn-helix transcriptional regulator [Ligilactobacillus animalis]MCI5941475.1 helix-turn-helix domain-containing protein [Ligilactobacillus animalis]MDY2992943.1 helix-turn-helix transcriptional regulator [Ligilactobacillus animalis]